MTLFAKGDQVFFRIITRVAAELLVVDLKLAHSSAPLALPTIPLEDVSAQLLVGRRFQPQPWLFQSNRFHDALGRIS